MLTFLFIRFRQSSRTVLTNVPHRTWKAIRRTSSVLAGRQRIVTPMTYSLKSMVPSPFLTGRGRERSEGQFHIHCCTGSVSAHSLCRTVKRAPPGPNWRAASGSEQTPRWWCVLLCTSWPWLRSSPAPPSCCPTSGWANRGTCVTDGGTVCVALPGNQRDPYLSLRLILVNSTKPASMGSVSSPAEIIRRQSS